MAPPPFSPGAHELNTFRPTIGFCEGAKVRGKRSKNGVGARIHFGPTRSLPCVFTISFVKPDANSLCPSLKSYWKGLGPITKFCQASRLVGAQERPRISLLVPAAGSHLSWLRFGWFCLAPLPSGVTSCVASDQSPGLSLQRALYQLASDRGLA